MATGVQPRDEDCQLTRTDLEAIQDAMKTKKFRDLLAEYCEEIRDPANQALYQQEMTQLEKERGYDVTFINPKGGYVIKTSVAGDRKAFINICSNDQVGKPSCDIKLVDGRKGMNWQIPYSLIPPREDFDRKRERCVVYDVVYHPDTLRMAEQNKQFRQLVNNTAIDALQKTYNIHLDSNNFRFPKSNYKGITNPAVIRKEDPNYKPPTDEETEDLPQEMMEKLYPQRMYNPPEAQPAPATPQLQQLQPRRKVRSDKDEFTYSSKNGYTVPKYIIKQQKNIDLQDYTYHRESKQHSAIPCQIVVEIYLPLLSSTKDCTLDVQERTLSLISEKPAKYKLELTLPYAVNDQCGNAKFDKSKHKLIVSLPVIRKTYPSDYRNSLKVDSGVESEENSGSQSDEERDPLVVELSSTPADNTPLAVKAEENGLKKEMFIDTSLAYVLPAYTHNVMDDTLAFTFHVKNTEPDSVKVKQEDNKVLIKFTSVGAGFVPVHYAAVIAFEDNVYFENISGEAWDNNVILQLNVTGKVPQKFQIGLSEDNLISEQFDVSTKKSDDTDEMSPEQETPPVIEVTNLGTETSIVVSSNDTESSDDAAYSTQEREIRWTESMQSDSAAKSILRKRFSRSYSESSVGDVASSMDYFSSDCIPEESSLKKTVRFSDVIARQFYRHNSSIEGQKKKNQRKKSKKRTNERRKSESEAEDDAATTKNSKPKLKPVIKPRRDSGLADTSDADTDTKNTPDSETNYFPQEKDRQDANTSVLDIVDNNGNAKREKPVIWESEKKISEKSHSGTKEVTAPTTCDNLKHNTDLYNPDNLNKGHYLEVQFKNDLIFDLDM